MNKNKKNRIFMLLLLAILFYPAPYAKELTFAAVENSADAAAGETILRNAYRRIGIDLVIRRYPAERAIRMAAAGLVDGEVQRIKTVGDQYPELIRIEPAINYLDAVVFSSSVEFSPSGWESLRPYRIGVIRGIRFAENNTEGMNRHRVGSYRSLFRMLENGRLDLAIAPKINGILEIQRYQFFNIHALSPPIERFELFHYLHQKNRHLVARISNIISEMRSTGELETIRARVISETLESARHSAEGCSENVTCEINGPFRTFPSKSTTPDRIPTDVPF